MRKEAGQRERGGVAAVREAAIIVLNPFGRTVAAVI